MPTPHLIFDLDGTLSDPAVGILRSLNYALTSFGYPEVTASGISAYIGPPIDVTFQSLIPNASDQHVLALVARFRERYADIGYAENTLYPGIPEALTALASSGASLGVCTAKRVDIAEKVLTTFELRGHFRFVCGGDVGVSKSDQLARLLVEGTVGSGSTMIGDRAVDVLAAKQNSLQSIGVLWGHGSHGELINAGADRLMSRPTDLQELLTPLLLNP
jgi:phosphoglycolate phosphatase